MKIILTLSILFVSLLSFTQVDEIVYGKEYVNNKKNAFNGFIGETTIALYGVDYSYINKKKQELTIRKFYKNDLSLIESKNIYSNPMDDYYSTPLELYFVKDKFYLFSELSNFKENKTVIGLFIYDENMNEKSFSVVDTVAVLDQTDIEVKKINDLSGFVILQNHPHKIASRQVVDLKHINLQGESEWHKELLSTNSIHKIKLEKIICSPNQTYILCNYGYKNYDNKSTSNPTILSNKYTLWIYNRELNFMKEVVLRLKGKWINGIDIALNKQKELIIGGYVNTSRDFGVNATFSLLLNKSYDPKKINFTKFATDDYAKFLKDKALTKAKYLEDVYLRDLIVNDDGSFYILGEMYYKYVDRSYDPRTNITTTTDHYNYNSIIVSYYSRMGKLQWLEHIPKFQNSTNDYGFYSSYSWLNTSDQLILFYNDNERNLELAVPDYFNHKVSFNYRKNSHTYVILNKDGIVKRSKLNTGRTSYILYPKQSFSLNSTTLYLMSEYGRHAKIMSVSFK